MGVIAKNDRELKLYYNSETSIGKQTLPYVEASEKEIVTIDISKTKVTGTQWVEIAGNLNLHISQLVNQKHPDFVQIFGDKEVHLEDHDWLKLIEKNPIIVNYPIVINGNQFLQIKSPSDVERYLE